jgi:hypothetical protein
MERERIGLFGGVRKWGRKKGRRTNQKRKKSKGHVVEWHCSSILPLPLFHFLLLSHIVTRLHSSPSHPGNP